MNIEVIKGVIRHILTAAGGALVAKGVVDPGAIEPIVGGVVALVGVIWSIAAKKKAA